MGAVVLLVSSKPTLAAAASGDYHFHGYTVAAAALVCLSPCCRFQVPMKHAECLRLYYHQMNRLLSLACSLQPVRRTAPRLPGSCRAPVDHGHTATLLRVAPCCRCWWAVVDPVHVFCTSACSLHDTAQQSKARENPLQCQLNTIVLRCLPTENRTR